MNTYEFEYDTFCHENKKIQYEAGTLTEAARKFKKNCKVYKLLGIKENGANISQILSSVNRSGNSALLA